MKRKYLLFSLLLAGSSLYAQESSLNDSITFNADAS